MSERIRDYVIIGAGPAGMQLAHELKQLGHDYLVLEQGAAPGNFFTRYPRHRQLISVNKKYTGWTDPELNMRMDWNSLLPAEDAVDPLLFTEYSELFFPEAKDLLRYLADFAVKHELPIHYNTRVTRISKNDVFTITTADGEYRAKRLIIATGVSKPYVPSISGIELADQYKSVSVDPADFINQRVLIMGKGNSAFETAENLIASAAVVHVGGPHSLQLAWRTHFVGHLRAVNNGILDAYQLKLQHAILDGEVREIRKDDQGYLVTFAFTRAEQEIRKELRYDRVIACTGFRFDATIFAEDSRPELVINDRFPAQTSSWESVNVPDLYFTGTLNQMRDFKKSTSAFIHGFRYTARALAKVLNERYHQRAWPHTEVPSGGLVDAVIGRINRTSALYQQFGFLADVLIVEGESARYYQEMPVDLFHDSALGKAQDAFVITLDYGPDHAKIDPFDINVKRVSQDSANDSGDGHYLHPIVRHYRHGELVATHHITENLENEWDRPVHVGPLSDFLTRQLAAVSV